MKKTVVISGGNSGIGLEAAQQLAALGHHVVLLGRDQAKGQAAAHGIGSRGGSAEFHAVDLSTHQGVKQAAEKLLALHPRIDGLVLGAGVLTFKDMRTADGLHPVLSTNYLSRYHLAQRLLPALRAAGDATVVLLVAGVPAKTRIDFSLFPKFEPWPGPMGLGSIQIANFHYVAHLAKAEPGLRAAVANVGLVKTDIMRQMPWVMRVGFNLLSPLYASVERAAANLTWLTTQPGWPSGYYWSKPGKTDVREPLAYEETVTAKVVALSRELTGI